ncbi:hypothetical protein Mapa_015270 [Marchantia paleacea]|nr:hypothetical protein Mapa_015270 [Marchantia paleacea]
METRLWHALAVGEVQTLLNSHVESGLSAQSAVQLAAEHGPNALKGQGRFVRRQRLCGGRGFGLRHPLQCHRGLRSSISCREDDGCVAQDGLAHRPSQSRWRPGSHSQRRSCSGRRSRARSGRCSARRLSLDRGARSGSRRVHADGRIRHRDEEFGAHQRGRCNGGRSFEHGLLEHDADQRTGERHRRGYWQWHRDRKNLQSRLRHHIVFDSNAEGEILRLHGEIITYAVGLSIAVVPEGLLSVITITMAFGVRRVAKQRALVGKLVALESLQAFTNICSDKTGTLTQSKMTVTRVWTSGKEYVFSVSNDGAILLVDQTLDHRECCSDLSFRHLVECCASCNTASSCTIQARSKSPAIRQKLLSKCSHTKCSFRRA